MARKWILLSVDLPNLYFIDAKGGNFYCTTEVTLESI